MSLAQNNLGFWIDSNNVRIDIISTDYTSYAVCASWQTAFGSNVWILTRNLDVDALLKYKIEVILSGINFSPRYLIETPFDSYTCGDASITKSHLIIYLICLSLVIFLNKIFN